MTEQLLNINGKCRTFSPPAASNEAPNSALFIGAGGTCSALPPKLLHPMVKFTIRFITHFEMNRYIHTTKFSITTTETQWSNVTNKQWPRISGTYTITVLLMRDCIHFSFLISPCGLKRSRVVAAFIQGTPHLVVVCYSHQY